MVKTINFAKGLTFLSVVLLCGVSLAGPTYSFLRLSSQSESTGLGQPGYTSWSTESSLGNALSAYKNMPEQNFYGASIASGLSGLPLTAFQSTGSAGAVGFLSGNSNFETPAYNNPYVIGSNGARWSYWYRSSNGQTTSGWDISGLGGNVIPTIYSDSPDNGPVIIPPDAIIPSSNSVAVPAPAAISLGCMGLMLVGWLRNRKAF